jgi:hypothetical protein
MGDHKMSGFIASKFGSGRWIYAKNGEYKHVKKCNEDTIEEFCLLGYYAMYSLESQLMFWRNMLL